ncbi:MFS transporter [Brevibacterium yomogidense]|uniref:Putative transmembrane efflux protein n=1 Tax=Brevibacterium yomogidense TaxID=946573 RepID=A0A1X6X9Y6_9MICO|nr:MFS transporter [Brevibacterium yomogidense]SLM96061.1 putative transmembrane efflux protein [Brevibacterium yomogidense]
MRDSTRSSAHAEGFTAEQRRILLVSLIVAFLSLLSVSIVNVVLPSIEASLAASSAALQWILSGYALAFGVVLVAAGRAGDIYGRGRVFIAGLVLFGAGSLVAGFSSDPLTLNVARVVMGLGSGFINPQVTGLIQQYFAGALRGRAFGLFGGIIGVSVAVGPVLGGVFVAAFGAEWGWRASFLVNVPFVVLAVIGAFLWLPPSAWRAAVGSSPANSAAATPQTSGAVSEVPRASRMAIGMSRITDLDPLGVVLLGMGTLLVMLPFVEREAGTWIWASLPIGLLLVVVWVQWEKRCKRSGHAPMVDIDLFRTRSFSNGTLLVSVHFLGMTSVWVLLALWMQSGLGHTALAAGLIGLPSALANAIFAPIAGRHITRIGRPLVLWGFALALTGLALTVTAVVLHYAVGTSEWWLLCTLGLLGAGQALIISPNQTLTLSEVPLRYAGSAGGVLQTGQRVGTSIGIAVITGITFTVLASHGWMTAFVVGFAVIFVVVAAAAAVGVVDLLQGRRNQGARQNSDR